jgi:hypothetical protein
VDAKPDAWSESIEKWAKDLAAMALNFVALQVRVMSMKVSDDRYVEENKSKKTWFESAVMLVKEIQSHGGEVVCIEVERPNYLPKEQETLITDDLTELLVRTPMFVLTKLQDEIRKSRRRTNIDEWRNCLDWVTKTLDTLQSYKNHL